MNITTIPEKEKFLRVIPQIGRYLGVLRAEMEDLNLLLNDAPITKYEGPRVQQQMADPSEHWIPIIEKKKRLEKKIRFLENALLDIYEKTMEAVNKLPDLDERSILFYKYFKTDAPLSDNQLGEIFCLARTTVYNKRMSALKNLKIPECVSYDRLCAMEKGIKSGRR